MTRRFVQVADCKWAALSIFINQKLKIFAHFLTRLIGIGGALLALCQQSPLKRGKPAKPTELRDPIPVMAYYYIWYKPESWNRAKK